MYTPEEQTILLQLAKQSLQWSTQHPQPMPIKLEDYPEKLQQQRACFVTLHKNGQLRGCIGSLQAHRPLVLDVVSNAFAAAQKDPRFPAVKQNELNEIDLDISILTPPEPMQFTSEADFMQQLRPGIDGIIIEDKGRRATFLPSVWEQLPDKLQFMQHLKQKAGLPANYWSDTIKVQRYQSEMIK